MRRPAAAGELSVVPITHKFREVMAFAREVSVPRAGRRVGGAIVAETEERRLAAIMFGEDSPRADVARAPTPPAPRYLEVEGLEARGDRGAPALDGAMLSVATG